MVVNLRLDGRTNGYGGSSLSVVSSVQPTRHGSWACVGALAHLRFVQPQRRNHRAFVPIAQPEALALAERVPEDLDSLGIVCLKPLAASALARRATARGWQREKHAASLPLHACRSRWEYELGGCPAVTPNIVIKLR